VLVEGPRVTTAKLSSVDTRNESVWCAAHAPQQFPRVTPRCCEALSPSPVHRKLYSSMDNPVLRFATSNPASIALFTWSGKVYRRHHGNPKSRNRTDEGGADS
jgi:hypothetical protein